jgi:acyl-CoA hydrolase
MKWIDQAGYTAATGWCGQYCVTVYVGGIRFHQPIRIGELVEVTARIILTGNTSMHLSVDVAAADPKTRAFRKTTHCVVIFVAVDADGRPTPVPTWEPATPEDRGLADYARRLMALREGIEEEMNRFL